MRPLSGGCRYPPEIGDISATIRRAAQRRPPSKSNFLQHRNVQPRRRNRLCRQRVADNRNRKHRFRLTVPSRRRVRECAKNRLIPGSVDGLRRILPANAVCITKRPHSGCCHVAPKTRIFRLRSPKMRERRRTQIGGAGEAGTAVAAAAGKSGRSLQLSSRSRLMPRAPVQGIDLDKVATVTSWMAEGARPGTFFSEEAA